MMAINTNLTSRNILRSFFADTPNSDEVSYEEIIRVTGRSNKPEPSNRQWLSNKLSILRYDDLIDTEYVVDGRKKVSAVRLTDKGKQLLGRINGHGGQMQIPTTYSGGREVTLESVVRDINYLKKQNPSLEFTFQIKPKEEGRKITVG